MNHVNRQPITDQEHLSFLPLSFVSALERFKKAAPLKFIWWCLALSILSGTLVRYLTEPSGLAYFSLTVLGSGGCAWFWLLSRSLFDNHKTLDSKVMRLVVVIIAVEALEALVPSSSTSGLQSEFIRVFSNAASLICIAVIVCICYEVLHGFNRIRSHQERQFRMAYLGMFSIPVAIAILWVLGADSGTFAAQWKNALMSLCALIALVGSRLAVEYRLYTSRAKAPLSDQDSHEAAHLLANSSLAEKIHQALNNGSLLTQTNLKVSDLADHLGVLEYKVTRCITHTLNYRNFNQILNKHRIDRALEILKNPDNNHLNIATIAFDCGYNSLGPFNRAFKQHTDKTPTQFRQANTEKSYL